MKFSNLNMTIRNIDNSLIDSIKNRMTQNKIIWMPLDKIIIDSEIENIFIQKETDIQNIADNMLESIKAHKQPFDPVHPIILAHSKSHPELNNINADGNTRYKAAVRVGLKKVAIIYKEFVDREELLKFVYQQQLLRRNLSESEVFNAWAALNRLTNENGKKAKSDTEIAEELKISRSQVHKIKTVEKFATPEDLEHIKAGEVSINHVFNSIKQNKSKNNESSESADMEKSKNTTFKNEDKKSKSSKVTSNDYVKGYEAGWMYVLECFDFGKTSKELHFEFEELKSGSIALEELQESLKLLKENYEQKQTE